MDRARRAVANQQREYVRQKIDEFIIAHLAVSHRELSMMNFPKTTHVSFDLKVVRRIDERHRALFFPKQNVEHVRI